MQYITKDVGEKLDYTFIRTVDDNIINVSYVTDGLGGLVVESCTVNTGIITDTQGNTYSAGRAIVLWVSGGNVGATETVTVTYTTAGGRIKDEAIKFRLIADN